MKQLVFTLIFSLVIIYTIGIDLKVISLEKCYGNEKFLVIKKCEILDDNLFEVKAYLVSHVDSIIVSIFSMKLKFCIKNLNLQPTLILPLITTSINSQSCNQILQNN